MSRTYKDQPWRVRELNCTTWGFKQHNRPKKRKHQDTEYHWMSTPSHWTHIMMIRPRRARENQSLRCMGDINEFDFVDTGRKPHIYYW